MVYRMKIYVKNRRRCLVDAQCGEDTKKSVEDNLASKDVEFLDMDDIIIRKEEIRWITVEQISEK